MGNVEFPEMRLELLSNLEGLSDRQYQQTVWVEHRPWGSVEYDDFDNAVHFLFDDTHLSQDAHGCIGSILIDKAEAERIQKLIVALDSIFEKYGTRLTDAQYIALPEWAAVVEAAKAALAVMPDQPDGNARE